MTARARAGQRLRLPLQRSRAQKGFERRSEGTKDCCYAIQAHREQQNGASSEAVGDWAVDELHKTEGEDIGAEHQISAASADPGKIPERRDTRRQRVRADRIGRNQKGKDRSDNEDAGSGS